MGDLVQGPWATQDGTVYINDVIQILHDQLMAVTAYVTQLELRIQALERERHKSNMSPDLP